MKRIIVVAKYEAYVPEDMSIESLIGNIEDTFENNMNDFGVSSEGYHDEDKEWVVFNHDSISVGTKAVIMISED
ncbi:hypothetical protein [Myroides sp.]|uniref:hypothetical protein n=1 Tax=Myroides sp. TaxID=1874736 RepID=UPI003F415E97